MSAERELYVNILDYAIVMKTVKDSLEKECV